MSLSFCNRLHPSSIVAKLPGQPQYHHRSATNRFVDRKHLVLMCSTVLPFVSTINSNCKFNSIIAIITFYSPLDLIAFSKKVFIVIHFNCVSGNYSKWPFSCPHSSVAIKSRVKGQTVNLSADESQVRRYKHMMSHLAEGFTRHSRRLLVKEVNAVPFSRCEVWSLPASLTVNMRKFPFLIMKNGICNYSI